MYCSQDTTPNNEAYCERVPVDLLRRRHFRITPSTGCGLQLAADRENKRQQQQDTTLYYARQTYVWVERIYLDEVVVDQQSSDSIQRLGRLSVFHSLKHRTKINSVRFVKTSNMSFKCIPSVRVVNNWNALPAEAVSCTIVNSFYINHMRSGLVLLRPAT